MNNLSINVKTHACSGCYPAAIEITELLQKTGYAFSIARTGGGCTDLYHTGTVAYHAEYSSFEAFKNCFEADYEKKYKELEAEYGSWMSSLDYEDIYFEMKKGMFSLRALVENYGSNIEIWPKTANEQAGKEMRLLAQFIEEQPNYSIGV